MRANFDGAEMLKVAEAHKQRALQLLKNKPKLTGFVARQRGVKVSEAQLRYLEVCKRTSRYEKIPLAC
jgi:hypothetical protein